MPYNQPTHGDDLCSLGLFIPVQPLWVWELSVVKPPLILSFITTTVVIDYAPGLFEHAQSVKINQSLSSLNIEWIAGRFPIPLCYCSKKVVWLGIHVWAERLLQISPLSSRKYDLFWQWSPIGLCQSPLVSSSQLNFVRFLLERFTEWTYYVAFKERK